MGREQEETHSSQCELTAGPSLPPSLPPCLLPRPLPVRSRLKLLGPTSPTLPSMASLGYTLGIWVEVLLLESPTSCSLTGQEEHRL